MALFSQKKPRLDVGVKKFTDELAAQNGAPLYTLSPEEARQVLINQQSGRVKKPDVDIKDTEIPGGPTGKVDVRVIRPIAARDRLPCIIFMHGGGWVMGNPHTHDRLVRELAVEIGAAVIFVDYEPSPEARFPVALEQGYAAMEYVVKHPDTFGIDPDGVVVAGDSAGGNMATVLAMMAKERGGPNIIFQLLMYPVTNAEFDTESYKTFADGPWLTLKAMKWFWDAYEPDLEKRRNPHVSPLMADEDALAGLPPALVIVDENDVLRDEGEAYAAKMNRAGVKAGCVRINGGIHDFMMLDALADTIPNKMALALAVAEVKKAFQTTIFPEPVHATHKYPNPAM